MQMRNCILNCRTYQLHTWPVSYIILVVPSYVSKYTYFHFSGLTFFKNLTMVLPSIQTLPTTVIMNEIKCKHNYLGIY